MQPAADDSAFSAPLANPAIPRRFWWLKRLFVAFILYVGLLLVFRTISIKVNRARLQAEIDRLHAAGEPVLVEDFRGPPVADSENTASLLNEVVRQLRLNTDDETAVEAAGFYPPFSPQAKATISQYEARLAPALHLLRAARTTTKADWKLKMESPAIGILLPMINDQRDLANLLARLAMYAHERGDDAAATEYILDQLTVSQAISQQPFSISHLVASGITDQALDVAVTILPTLRISEISNDRSATSSQVRSLIAKLLDEEASRRSLLLSARSEHMTQIDSFINLGEGRTTTAVVIGLTGRWNTNQPMPIVQLLGDWALRPVYYREAVEALIASRQFIDAANQTNFAAALAGTTAWSSRFANAKLHWQSPISLMFSSGMSNLVGRHFLDLQRRSQVAVNLAAKLYAAKKGAAPAKVDDLVPDFLPAVPLDTGDGVTPLKITLPKWLTIQKKL